MMSQESGSSGEKLSFESDRDLESSQDEQITLALEQYARLKRAGRLPPRDEFLARHPTIADALGECLDGLELVEDAASHFAPGREDRLPAVDVQPPAQLGEFRLIREIGRGATGVVFEAEQVSVGRRVALKVLPAGVSRDSRHRHRFQAEAQAAGFLRHEHIVPVFGTGFDAGVHYCVMQLIDGRPLSDVLQELKITQAAADRSVAARIDLPQLALAVVGSAWRGSGSARSSNAFRRHCHKAVRWAVQAADALEHAHQIGVVHRGIKPSNLLVDHRGRLWVADFGQARLPQERNERNLSDEQAAALRYSSPEQLGGGWADARSDIYALAVTLYELLTLHPAHAGRTRRELCASVLRQSPAPPRRLNPSIARDVETVVLKAIEKDPSARYASAREFAADLRRILADQPVRARRPGLLQRSIRWSRTHRPAVISSVSALVLSLAASTALFWDQNRRTAANLDELRRLEMQEHVALDNALSAIDQITLTAMESRKVSGIPRDTVWPRAVLHPIAISQVASRIYAEDADLLALAAHALRRAGRSRLVLDDARGRDDFRRAIRIYEELIVRFPERSAQRLDLIETLREFAALLVEPIDSAEAEESARRALELADAPGGTD